MSGMIKNYLYNVVGLATGVLFPVLTFPYISRVLMPENLGKVSFAQSVTNYFLIGAMLGIPNYATRELSRAKVLKNGEGEFKKIFNELLVIGVIGSVISALLLGIATYTFPKLHSLKAIIGVFSFQIIFAFLQVDHIFIVLERHKSRTYRTLFIRMISLIFMFFWVKTPEDYLLYGVVLVVPELVARAIDLYVSREYIYIKLKKLNLQRHMKPLLTIFLYMFSVGVYLNLDASMLGFLRDNREVGLYTSAIKMTKIAVPIMAVLGTVMSPRIIGAIKNRERKEIYRYMDIFADFNFLIGAPLSLLLFILAESWIQMFSGRGYEEAVITMRIMSPIVFTIPLATFLGAQVLLPNDKESLVFRASFTAMVTNGLINYLLIPKYGKEGAAFSTIITEGFVFLYRVYEVKKIYPDYRFLTEKRVKYIIATLVAALGALLINRYGFESLSFRIIVVSGVFVAIYYILLKFALKKINKR